MRPVCCVSVPRTLLIAGGHGISAEVRVALEAWRPGAGR